LGQTTGTLQLPTHKTPQTEPTPPSAAPRTPVVQAGGATSPAHPAARPAKKHVEAHHPKPGTPAATAKSDKTKPAPAAAAAPATPHAAPDAAKPETAEKLPDPEKPEGAPSKLPRFASLRSDDVNMRVGPGTRYRIEWVYKRRDLPVEIEREFDVWRWVEDSDGNRGWVHQATLMGRRSFVVPKTEVTLRSDPSDTASAVAILKPGVIGRIRSCEAGSAWCNVQTGSYRGYLRRDAFWGTLPNEVVGP
jgi:SH3-like domain-containing protein